MLTARKLLLACGGALVLAALPACIGTPISRTASPLQARTARAANYFDAVRIQRADAANAWDAVRRLAPHVRLVEPHPWGVRRDPMTAGSGQSGALAARLILDGFAQADPTVLRAIPASSVVDIEVLGATDATMRLGLGYGGGAVIIRTALAGRD